MHTDSSSKRRTLLLLFLLLSVITLFDAILLVKQKEPQTYQPKAQESLTQQTSGANFVANYMDSLGLSVDEHPEVIGGLAEILRANADDLSKARQELTLASAKGDLKNIVVSLGKVTDIFDQTRVNVAATAALIDYYTATPSAGAFGDIQSDQRVKGAMIAQRPPLQNPDTTADNVTIANVNNLINNIEQKINSVEGASFNQDLQTITDNISTMQSLLQTAGDDCEQIKQAAQILQATQGIFDSNIKLIADAVEANYALTSKLRELSTNQTFLPNEILNRITEGEFLHKIILLGTTLPYVDFRPSSAVSLELNRLSITIKFNLKQCEEEPNQQLDNLINTLQGIKIALNDSNNSPKSVAEKSKQAATTQNETIASIVKQLSAANGQITIDVIRGFINQAQTALGLLRNLSSAMTQESNKLNQFDLIVKEIKANKAKIEKLMSSDNPKMTALTTLLTEVEALMGDHKSAVTEVNKSITESIVNVEGLLKRLNEILQALQDAFRNRGNICEFYDPSSNDASVKGQLLSCQGLPAGSSCIYYGLTPTPQQTEANRSDDEKKDKYQCRIVATTGGIKGWDFGRVGVGRFSLNLGGADIKNVCACKKGSFAGNLYRGGKHWVKNNPLQVVGVVGAGVAFGEEALQKVGIDGDGGEQKRPIEQDDY